MDIGISRVMQVSGGRDKPNHGVYTCFQQIIPQIVYLVYLIKFSLIRENKNKESIKHLIQHFQIFISFLDCGIIMYILLCILLLSSFCLPASPLLHYFLSFKLYPMLQEIKGSKLITGFRVVKDVVILAACICKLCIAIISLISNLNKNMA